MHTWESLNATLQQLPEVFTCLGVPQHGHISHLSLETWTWTSTIHENALLGPILYHLQVLKINGSIDDEERPVLVLNVLPSFHKLRELELVHVDVPPLAHDVDLPLVHTLRKLSLWYSTLSWMGGLVFTQLQKFAVDEHSLSESFKGKVGMPACACIAFAQNALKKLPVLLANFDFPLLDAWEFRSTWHDSHYDQGGFSVFQRVHAKVFKFRIGRDDQRWLEWVEYKDEVEQLELVLEHSTVLFTDLVRLSVVKHVTGKLPCPNMKALKLRFINVKSADQEQVRQSCMQMMDDRRLAGYFLEKCYIWWQRRDWLQAASLVLVMENKGSE